MKQFIVGKTYLRPGLYGPSFWVLIINRTKNTITFEELNFPNETATYSISHDRFGNEIAAVWQDEDEIGYMRA